jgi:2-keto-4-pentenoate hydratase/2-oxohepta-3-ene-1,7-dioic acid hydratase in catechol pathway
MRKPCDIRPSKIVAVGLNYSDHIKEFDGRQKPANPILFMKPSTSVIRHGDPIVYPAGATRVDYEGELAVVIGKRCRNATQENALDFVEGYSCLNDVTERDMQKADGQWTRAKGFDTFCPIGPEITDEIDPSNAAIRCWVNGELRQDSNIGNMIFPVPQLIAFISSVMTLLPGDVIATGTPSGVGPLKPGDVARVEIEGIGILENPVTAE